MAQAFVYVTRTTCQRPGSTDVGERVPECNLLIIQPRYRLCKLAERTAWECGDIMPRLIQYTLIQIAVHE